jgi:SAM-dependent methyltransferase
MICKKGTAMVEPASVVRHYGSGDLTEKLKAALTAAGFGNRRLSPTDLAPLDQFHSRGLAATVDLAQALDISPGASVLDIGSGLGGPSRYLAATFGCEVRGIDLSPSFVDAAVYLAERTGLGGKVAYECGDALSLPYQDESFDVAWTQHVAMNIANRSQLYGEAFRVLRSCGRLAIYDVVSGDGGPLHFPVPWAAGLETSHVVSPGVMRVALEGQGFRIVSWVDRTDVGIGWFAERQKAQTAAEGQPPIGLHIVMGPDFPIMSNNLARNLREGRAGLVEAVLEKP